MTEKEYAKYEARREFIELCGNAAGNLNTATNLVLQDAPVDDVFNACCEFYRDFWDARYKWCDWQGFEQCDGFERFERAGMTHGEAVESYTKRVDLLNQRNQYRVLLMFAVKQYGEAFDITSTMV